MGNSMIRAIQVLPAGNWDRKKEADAIELSHDGRHRRRIVMKSAGGTEFLLDLADTAILRDGDGLALDDGRIVRVVAAAEPVAEISGEPKLIARIAWHLGNRHVPAEILPNRILIAHDHVLEEMVQSLGARVRRIMSAFDPEPGAYHGHHHDHDHGH